jgi:lipopolysaccharide/colanic/teichoic acid biosynthesis glycosyltransferase
LKRVSLFTVSCLRGAEGSFATCSAPQCRGRSILAMTAEPMALTSAITIDAAAAAARPSATGRIERTSVAARAATKRALDIVVALALLLVLLPLFALVALAILREGGGPVFYRAVRIGRFGRPFSVVKFRSMRSDCDQSAHADFVRDLMRGTTCSVYKVPDDPRITKLGAFLRRTSVDELPQLWNVLRGEMSLVGPRPDVPYAFAEYADWIHARLAVRPGITGLWQVSGRSRLSLLEMYRLDVAYAAHPSLLADLRILLRTVPVVLGRDGAA